MADTPLTDLDRALALHASREKGYRLYSDYYAGKHQLSYASQKFRSAFAGLFTALADNLCKAIVNTVADRLRITGFATAGVRPAGRERLRALLPAPPPPAPPRNGHAPTGQAENGAPPTPPGALYRVAAIDSKGPPDEQVPPAPAGPPPDPLGDAAWAIWQANRMTRVAGSVHLEALRCGDAYVVVWPDRTGAPEITFQRADLMTVQYDADRPGVILWAAKRWVAADDRVRVTLYYPDRLERWVTRRPTGGQVPASSKDFERYLAPEDNGAWPVANPYGRVPVFHFAANADAGAFGHSELEDVIPLQNALNKTICDMLVGMEFTAFPQRWIAGLDVPLDELTGRPISPFIPGEDRVWAVEDKEVRFGEFPAAGLDNYLRVADGFRWEIARVSNTPLHYLALTGARWPSGEALRLAETPLVEKALDRMDAFGEVWGEALTFALEIAKQAPPGAKVAPEWRDPRPHSELELAQKLQIWHDNLNIPDPVIWDELSFSDAEIAMMQEMHAQADPGSATAAALRLVLQALKQAPAPGDSATQELPAPPPPANVAGLLL